MKFNIFRKQRSFKYEFQSCYLFINLKNGWTEYTEEDKEKHGLPIAFIKEVNGVGALQISVFTSKTNDRIDLEKQLKEDAQANLLSKRYKLREWNVYEYEKRKNGFFTKSFEFIKSSIVVYITYNCGLKSPNEKELSEAIEIAKSIHVEKSDSNTLTQFPPGR